MESVCGYSSLDRFKKRIFGNGLSWEKISCLVIVFILGVVFLSYIFTGVDFIPATSDDYTLLEKQLLEIQENPESILIMEGNLTIKHGSIKFCIENDQCKMIGFYDESYNLIETHKEDKAKSLVECIFVAVVLTFLLGLGVYYILFVIIVFVEALILCIFEKCSKCHT